MRPLEDRLWATPRWAPTSKEASSLGLQRRSEAHLHSKGGLGGASGLSPPPPSLGLALPPELRPRPFPRHLPLLPEARPLPPLTSPRSARGQHRGRRGQGHRDGPLPPSKTVNHRSGTEGKTGCGLAYLPMDSPDWLTGQRMGLTDRLTD